MKNLPIKFRGKDIITKEYLYGDYISHNDGTCAIRVKDRDNLFDFHEYEIAVEKDSVAQLVGYDVNGDEVYEGDRIKALATGDVTRAKICACDTYESAITTAYFEKV